jgi:L-seryl-tRNA(Ser) seleniumtransferase
MHLVSTAVEFPRIPPMNQLLVQAEQHCPDAGRESLRNALTAELQALRDDIRGGVARQLDQGFWAAIVARIEVVPAVELCGAINATGVVLHTNLGRAPWCAEAVQAAAAASRAAVLEIDPKTGRRGRRERAVSALLQQLTGAEAGLPVNNNAAALMLAVSALGRGRKTVLARGEMVEIGGSYRMPEVVVAAGSGLVEVGTANRVHLKDYQAALKDPQVSCVLKVHRSNFEQHGFVGEPSTKELAELCRAHGVPLVYDLGSGVLVGGHLPGVEDEPSVAQALKDGCDVVTFSGDKLLGGPQAGLIVGAAPLVEKLRSDMLTRCLRLDKTLLAALEATLSVLALGEAAALQRLPALRQLAATVAELQARAEKLTLAMTEAIPDLEVEVVPCAGRVGSGAAPIRDLPGVGLRLHSPQKSSLELAASLRLGRPPVFARLHEDRLLLDLRTIEADQEADLVAVIRAVLD